jgi:hypothetical protein
MSREYQDAAAAPIDQSGGRLALGTTDEPTVAGALGACRSMLASRRSWLFQSDSRVMEPNSGDDPDDVNISRSRRGRQTVRLHEHYA